MRQKDDLKEQAILEAALQMIAEQGLAGLKMSELAKRAKLAIGTLYIYFADKDALIQALYLTLLRKSAIDLMSGIDPKASIQDKIYWLFEAYLNENLEHPEHTIFFDQYYRSPYYQATDMLAQAEVDYLQPIYEVVAQGQESGQIKAMDIELLVTLTCGAINEMASQAVIARKPVSPSTRRAAFQVLWDGIKI